MIIYLSQLKGPCLLWISLKFKELGVFIAPLKYFKGRDFYGKKNWGSKKFLEFQA